MFEKIIEYYKKIKASKNELKKIINDIKKLDHQKWYNPLIPLKEVEGYGYFKKDSNGEFIKNDKGQYIQEDPDFMCPNLFIRKHPDLEYEYYDGPFTAYPKGEKFNVSLLLKKDRDRLTRKFRDFVYKD